MSEKAQRVRSMDNIFRESTSLPTQFSQNLIFKFSINVKFIKNSGDFSDWFGEFGDIISEIRGFLL